MIPYGARVKNWTKDVEIKKEIVRLEPGKIKISINKKSIFQCKGRRLKKYIKFYFFYNYSLINSIAIGRENMSAVIVLPASVVHWHNQVR